MENADIKHAPSQRVQSFDEQDLSYLNQPGVAGALRLSLIQSTFETAAHESPRRVLKTIHKAALTGDIPYLCLGKLVRETKDLATKHHAAIALTLLEPPAAGDTAVEQLQQLRIRILGSLYKEGQIDSALILEFAERAIKRTRDARRWFSRNYRYPMEAMQELLSAVIERESGKPSLKALDLLFLSVKVGGTSLRYSYELLDSGKMEGETLIHCALQHAALDHNYGFPERALKQIAQEFPARFAELVVKWRFDCIERGKRRNLFDKEIFRELRWYVWTGEAWQKKRAIDVLHHNVGIPRLTEIDQDGYRDLVKAALALLNVESGEAAKEFVFEAISKAGLQIV